MYGYVALIFLAMWICTSYFTLFPPERYPQSGTVRILSGVALSLIFSALAGFVPVLFLYDPSADWYLIRLMHFVVFGIVAILYLIIAGMLFRAKFRNASWLIFATLGSSALAGFMIVFTWYYYQVLWVF